MLRFAAVIACACALVGCATVVRGTSEHVEFISIPEGAVMHAMIQPVCADGCPGRRETDNIEPEEPKVGPSCVTPCGLKVPRNQVWIVTFSKAGFEPQTVRLGLKLAAGGAVGVAGNAVVGGVLGGFTDLATGASNDHEPNPVKVTLVPIRQATPTERPAKRR